MNATRAATIRLRSSFDGAVSLGRVQTPTLAIIARREEEIRAFKPEPYWLVDAQFEPTGGDAGRRYEGRFHAGAQPRLKTEAEADGDRRGRPRPAGRDHQAREVDQEGARAAPLRPDVTAARRQHALRLLGAAHAGRRPAAVRGAQGAHLPAHELPLPAERHGVRAQADRRAASARTAEYAKAAAYVTGLDVLPLGRVVNDAKVTDHHAIIPTNAEHRVDKMSDDDRRIYDMVVRRFLAVFHPDAVFENTRLETTVAEHIFRTRGRVLVVPGLARRLRRGPRDALRGDDDEGDGSAAPEARARRGRAARSRSSRWRSETKPPRRYSDASLLGGDGDGRQARRRRGAARGDEGLRASARPATRAAIIERLIDVGYVEREGRALVCTEKGLNVIKFLGEHALTSPSMTGDWEHRLARIEEGEESRERFMSDIAEFARGTVHELDAKLKEVRIPRANLGPCPVCGRDIVENRKGFSCWSREDPGCGFVIWKSKAGKTLPDRRRARADRQGPRPRRP